MGESTSVAEAQAAWEAAAPEARKTITALFEQTKAQLAYAKDQQARWAKEMRALAAYKDDVSKPENNTYVSVAQLHEAYGAMQKMKEIELAALQHDLQVVSSQSAGAGNIAVPTASPAWVEQKRRMHLAMSRYLVRYNMAGIDAVLRAAGKPPAINPVDEAQRAERAQVTERLQAAAASSDALGPFLQHLGGELAALRDLNKRAMGVFAEWDRMDAAGREAVIMNPEWDRFEGGIELLQRLYERCAPFPTLQRLFVPWKQEKLPFSTAPVVVPSGGSEPPAKRGTDRFDLKAGKASTFRLP